MDFDRFHNATFADFRPVKTPRREPDFISASRSAYWDQGDRVIRCSDHWGIVRSCWWLFDGCRRHGPTMTGACRYDDFFTLVRLTREQQGLPASVPAERVRTLLRRDFRRWRGRRR